MPAPITGAGITASSSPNDQPPSLVRGSRACSDGNRGGRSRGKDRFRIPHRDRCGWGLGDRPANGANSRGGTPRHRIRRRVRAAVPIGRADGSRGTTRRPRCAPPDWDHAFGHRPPGTDRPPGRWSLPVHWKVHKRKLRPDFRARSRAPTELVLNCARFTSSTFSAKGWRQQPLRRLDETILPGKAIEPAVRNAAQAVEGTGELPRHRRYRVGVVGQVGRTAA